MISDEDKLLRELKDGATLVVDNDACYTTFQFHDDEHLGSSYDFGPKELVFILAGHLNFKCESC